MHAGGVCGARPTRDTHARACLTHPPRACDSCARLAHLQGKNGSNLLVGHGCRELNGATIMGCARGVRERRCGHACVERFRVPRASLDGALAYVLYVRVSHGSWLVAVAVLV